MILEILELYMKYSELDVSRCSRSLYDIFPIRRF